MNQRLSIAFSAWLKEQRKKYRLTQTELARRIHCASITIRKIEAGERRPSTQLAELLADYFAIPMQERYAFLHFARTDEPPHYSLPEPRSLPFSVDAAAIYLMEANTGSVLVNQNAQEPLPIASTTKIMTTLVALEHGDLEQCITIPQETTDRVQRCGGYTIGLRAGDQLSLKELLYALMLASGDEVALIIGEAVGGTLPAFVRLMNQYAQRLGLKKTHYLTPGAIIHPALVMSAAGEQHYSTAEDLVRLARHAQTNPLFAQIVQLQRYQIHETALHQAYTWETTNSLLSSYPGATGIKTGHSTDAGYCLVFSATSGKHHLIGAILQASAGERRDQDARRLLDWGFHVLTQP